MYFKHLGVWKWEIEVDRRLSILYAKGGQTGSGSHLVWNFYCCPSIPTGQKPCLFATISLFLSVGKASSTCEFHFKVVSFEIHRLSMQKLHWRGVFHSLNALFILLFVCKFLSVVFFYSSGRWWWTLRKTVLLSCAWRLWPTGGVWTRCLSRWPLTHSTWRVSCAHSTTSSIWMAHCLCPTATTLPSW